MAGCEPNDMIEASRWVVDRLAGVRTAAWGAGPARLFAVCRTGVGLAFGVGDCTCLRSIPLIAVPKAALAAHQWPAIKIKEDGHVRRY